MSLVFSPKGNVVEGIDRFDDSINIAAGDYGELNVKNLEMKEFLTLILIELKKTNFHLSSLSDEIIEEEDLS